MLTFTPRTIIISPTLKNDNDNDNIYTMKNDNILYTWKW